jgi:hypothetical protein
VNRYELAALGRATFTVAMGTAILYAIGRYLGWWVVVAIVAAGVGTAAWCLWQLVSKLPTRWRPW